MPKPAPDPRIFAALLPGRGVEGHNVRLCIGLRRFFLGSAQGAGDAPGSVDDFYGGLVASNLIV